ncbi:MAG: helix-turn-helix domain-containing protein [Actinomycetota bacterium]|nr:helix-turn-helix domain-containing protein [Actinomycetota bacterium]
MRIFVRRGRCGSCATTQALLPAFCVRNRLDTTETIGVALEAIADGGGVRPVASTAGVPHTTARGWVRRFSASAVGLATGFGGLAVDLGGAPLVPLGDTARWAVAAIGAAWRQAMGLPGWLAVGRWRFASSVCGGSLLAANTNSPWFVIGRRRYMPPVP